MGCDSHQAAEDTRDAPRLIEEYPARRVGQPGPVRTFQLRTWKRRDNVDAVSLCFQGLSQTHQPFNLTAQWSRVNRSNRNACQRPLSSSNGIWR